MSTLQPCSTSLGRIPAEILHIIFKSLSPCDLFIICTVSRAFYHEVERALYSGHVNLVNCTFDQHISFMSSISQRPKLAQLTHGLSLPGHIYANSNEPPAKQIKTLTGHISAALKSMHNLTSLFLERGRNDGRGLCYCTYPLGDTVLQVGCAFRRKSFRSAWGASLDSNTFFPLLPEQNQIRELDAGESYNVYPNTKLLTSDLLPDLSVISICYDTDPVPFLFTLMTSRRLTRLKLEMTTDNTQGDVESAMKALESSLASITLTHLHFCFDHAATGIVLEEDEHVEALEMISKAMPNLTFLRYSDAIPLDLAVSNQTVS